MYFVIESYDQLFEATAPDFTPYYETLKRSAAIAPGRILAEDSVVGRQGAC